MTNVKNIGSITAIDTTDIKPALELCITHDVVGYFEGPPGTAKTAGISQAADDLGYTLHIELLGANDPILWGGLKSIEERDGVHYTVNTVPAVIETVHKLREQHGKPVMLFFDELTLATQSMTSSILTFLVTRQLCGYPLDPAGTPDELKTVIVCAGNGAQDARGTTPLSGPALNRVRMFKVAPSVEAFYNWMLANEDPHPLLFGALSALGSEVLYVEDAGRRVTPFQSNRQWAKVNRTLNHFDSPERDGSGIKHALCQSSCTGDVGVEAWSKVSAVIDMASDLATPAEIIADPDAAKVPDVGDHKRMFLIVMVMGNMLSHCPTDERSRVAKAVFTYVRRLPRMYVVGFLTSLAGNTKSAWSLGHDVQLMSDYSVDTMAIGAER